ncbi:MAG: ethanolamine ammonia-lyase reactivating factor EutA [Xanthobacteraceae bacterium]|nr:ethanolamine ammonia-lyase reactivating factor EutA [Xanthobacteraceae bacterium]
MTGRDDRTPRHTLADHRLGADLAHSHDGDADHDHDDFDDGPIEDNPLWIADNVTLTSVGIDIGSAGTQVIFSKVHLRRLSEDLTSRYYVVGRETLFRSPVALTPYQSEELIDDDRLRSIIGEAYASAGIDAKDIDTGVVILTGEALRRENAQAIAGLLAAQGGDFVCATAGHHMEAMLAGYGSGAARVSSDQGKRILNIDIGGGTTKLALIENGRVAATAAIHIGGRLQVTDEQGRIVRLDPAGQHHAAQAGFKWDKGDRAESAELDRIAEYMADALVAAIRMRPLPPPLKALYLTEPIADLGAIDGIMVSGGVAEYVYGREERDFGDMGRRLGRALRRRLDAGALPWPLLPAGECIRATALGASEYSIQLSGNTSTITAPGLLLPRRNLQVLQPPYVSEETIEPDKLAAAIRSHFTAFDLIEGETEVALALRWRGAPSHERIFAFAQGIVRGMPNTIAQQKPLTIMLDGDVAQTLGAVLREELEVKSEILCIDGVVLWDFDYIDLGRIRLPSMTVPVTIKSLVFSEDPRLPRGKAHLHHHHHHHHHGHDHGHDHSHEHGHDHGHEHGRAHDQEGHGHR